MTQYVRIACWHQTAHRRETQRVPKGQVVYGVCHDDHVRRFDVIPTEAGRAAMAAIDNAHGGSDGKGWGWDDGDKVTRITYDQLPDEAVAAMAAAILLGEDDR